MTWRDDCAVLLFALLIVVGAGSVSVAQEVEGSSGGSSTVTRIRSAARAIGENPNGGVQLPRVSPNGRSIAYLQRAEDAGAIEPSALMTARGLETLSRWVRGIETESTPQLICASGAAWAAWSRDGGTLVFIAYDAQGRCSLRLYDRRSGSTRHLEVGLRRMMMPAMTPDGLWIAVAAYVEVPQKAGVYLIDTRTSRARLVSGDARRGPAVWPRWLGDDALLWIDIEDQSASLRRASVPGDQSEKIASMDWSGTLVDSLTMFAGIAQPVSPDGEVIAWYDAAEDRVAACHLAGDVRWMMPRGYRTAAWRSGRSLLLGSRRALSVVSLDDGPAGVAGRPAVVLRGVWAPLWADGASREAIVMGQTEDRTRFRLARVWAEVQAE